MQSSVQEPKSRHYSHDDVCIRATRLDIDVRGASGFRLRTGRPLIVNLGYSSGGETCTKGDGGGAEDGVRVVCIPEVVFANKIESGQVGDNLLGAQKETCQGIPSSKCWSDKGASGLTNLFSISGAFVAWNSFNQCYTPRT